MGIRSRESSIVVGFLLLALVVELSGCALTGASNTPPANPDGTLSAPLSISFGTVAVGSTTTQSAMLSNTGSAAVTVSQATISTSNFSLLGMSFPMTVGAGQVVPVQIQFAPQQAGNLSGTLSVTSNATDGTVSVALTGTGTAPSLSVSPATLAFGSVSVGGNSTASAMLTNSGNVSLTITSASLSGSAFSMSGLSTPLTLAANQSSTFSVQFAPTATGSASGSITLTSNAPGSPMTISLTGTGVSATLQLTFSPTALNFGNVQVGNTGTETATLTNSGNSSVTISQMTTSGTGYSASGVGAGQVLLAGQSVPITVTFTPTTTGSATGTVTITSNASNSPTAITLAGGSHLVDLSWTASTSTVVGYNIYRGTVSGGPYTVKLNATPVSGTSYTDTAVVAGQAYYYVVTAVDSSGVESVYSNQASATIPTP